MLRIGTRKTGNWAMCAFRVDDETDIGSHEQLDRVADMFCRMYGISGEGELRWTLGMKMKRGFSRYTVPLSQQSYIENLVERLGLQDAQAVTTALTPGTILTKDQCPTTPDEINDMAGSRYREFIGSLQYASLATRPDITYAVNKLAQFLANPTSTQPYESYATSKGRNIEASTLEAVFLTSPTFQKRIGEAITTIASPPVHIYFVSDSE